MRPFPGWLKFTLGASLFCAVVLTMLLSIFLSLSWATFDRIRIGTELAGVIFMGGVFFMRIQRGRWPL
jgi:hypothetical protein